MKDTIRLKEQMFLRFHADILTHVSVDERQFGQSSVEQVWQCLDNLYEGRLAHEHPMEHAILRVGIWVLLDATAGIWAISDVHGEQRLIYQHLTIHYQLHRDWLLLYDSTY